MTELLILSPDSVLPYFNFYALRGQFHKTQKILYILIHVPHINLTVLT